MPPPQQSQAHGTAAPTGRLAEGKPFPGFVPPCHPSERERPPSGTAWVHEIKADGYRAQVHVRAGKVVVYSRRGHDWTREFAPIARAARQLPVAHAVFDGEAIVQDARGIADFRALRRELAKGQGSHLTYYAFDLLYLDGEDLRPEPLIARKQRLQRLLAGAPPQILFADHLEAEGEKVYAEACRMGLEGIVSKRRDAPYRSGRQQTWIKTKCTKTGTFPIIAFVEKLGARPRRIASFYIGRREGNRLLYAGKVRTGFTEAEARALREQLDPLIATHAPLSEPIHKPKASWLVPRLAAEVAYGGITADGILRAAVYKSVREDLLPPTASPAAVRSRPAYRGGVPRENILQLLPDAAVPSKEQLRAYWRRVADRALPYLARRPLKLVRHTRATTFYHMGPLPDVPPQVHRLTIEKRGGGEGVRLWVDDVEGLLGLVEIGAVEVHPWAATVDDYEHADQLVFDLDPGAGVAWSFVVATAFSLRRALRRDGLDSWPKLTGGKGVHVMARLTRKLTHDAARAYARRLAHALAAARPDAYVTVADPARRTGRLFIDYLRNGRGATAVGAYSPRARPRFPIAAPVTWSALARGVPPDAYTLNAPFRRGPRQ